MIHNIDIKNFKCFETLEMSLSNLNVFSGMNGMGKSTVIQTLLLLKQSQEQDAALHKVILNGNYVLLGVGKDILYEDANSDNIKLCYTDESGVTDLHVHYTPDRDVLDTELVSGNIIKSLNSAFEYISAGRLAPQTVYEKSSYYVDIKAQLGIYGQYTAHYLASHQDDEIYWPNEHGDKFTLKMLTQIWLNEISPNVRLNTNTIQNADLAQINYYYTDSGDSTKTNEYRSTNVGFGISYVLPVITALLKAQSNSILIIENPEAHLHPHGQRKMGELIALCAARGIQIFVETHSDHILNGIRISVKSRTIDADAVRMFFFEKSPYGNKLKHIVSTPKILRNGRLDFWPDGFFDEWEKALDEIV